MAEARPESHAAAMEASSMSRPCGFGGENKEGLQGKNDDRSAVNWRGSASTWNCFTDRINMCKFPNKIMFICLLSLPFLAT